MKKEFKLSIIALLFGSFSQFTAAAPDSRQSDQTCKSDSQKLRVCTPGGTVFGCSHSSTGCGRFSHPRNSRREAENPATDAKKNQPLQPSFKKSEGGVDSGGGNLVLLKNGSYRLLELYLGKGTASPHPALNAIPAIPLRESKALRAWGIDRLDSTSTIYTKVIHNLLTKVEKTSPFTGALVKKAIASLPIYVVNYELQIQDKIFTGHQNTSTAMSNEL